MSEAYVCAVRLLARRDYSFAELEGKLAQKGYNHAAIQDALEICVRQGLQSDIRFVESLCRTRIRQGYGPIRIRQELQSKHISREMVEEVLRSFEEEWLDHARCVWEKKYMPSDEASFAEKQKQKQFLLYRGFPMEIITRVIL